jgi:hypothetical protein
MPLPDPWPLSAGEYAWIARKLPKLTNVDRHHEAFLDRHRLHDTKSGNWLKLWQGWIRIAWEREQSRGVIRDTTMPSDTGTSDQDHAFTQRYTQALARVESLMVTAHGRTDTLDDLRYRLDCATRTDQLDAIAYALDHVERQTPAFAPDHVLQEPPTREPLVTGPPHDVGPPAAEHTVEPRLDPLQAVQAEPGFRPQASDAWWWEAYDRRYESDVPRALHPLPPPPDVPSWQQPPPTEEDRIPVDELRALVDGFLTGRSLEQPHRKQDAPEHFDARALPAGASQRTRGRLIQMIRESSGVQRAGEVDWRARELLEEAIHARQGEQLADEPLGILRQRLRAATSMTELDAIAAQIPRQTSDADVWARSPPS